MNVKSLSIIAGLLATLGSTAALAEDEYTRNNPPIAISKTPRVVERVAAVDEYQRNQYSAAEGRSNVTRDQVVAEALEARKLGVIAEGELTVIATEAQAERIRFAGLRAGSRHIASK